MGWRTGTNLSHPCQDQGATKNRYSSLSTPWSHTDVAELHLHLFWTSTPDGGEYFACPLLSRLKTSTTLPPRPTRLHDVHKDKFTFVFNRLVGQICRQTDRRHLFCNQAINYPIHLVCVLQHNFQAFIAGRCCRHSVSYAFH